MVGLKESFKQKWDQYKQNQREKKRIRETIKAEEKAVYDKAYKEEKEKSIKKKARIQAKEDVFKGKPSLFKKVVKSLVTPSKGVAPIEKGFGGNPPIMKSSKKRKKEWYE